MYSRFPSNSEVDASELLGNLEIEKVNGWK